MSDTELMVMPEAVRRIEVFTGTGRRRRWPDDVKARIIAESCQPGASVSAVARHHGLTPQQLFTWRRLARRGALATDDVPLFAAVAADPVVSTGAASAGAADIVIDVGDLRLRIGPAVSAERAAALVSALRLVRR